ncbi:hypothetical protein VNO77_07334 [Canavalia gladiata]|uniref:Uncharacterized protein n=1 Tax=Canavalia gladiata TaxID=3824 RepID=A0AAN9MD74_CANGL
MRCLQQHMHEILPPLSERTTSCKHLIMEGSLWRTDPLHLPSESSKLTHSEGLENLSKTSNRLRNLCSIQGSNYNHKIIPSFLLAISQKDQGEGQLERNLDSRLRQYDRVKVAILWTAYLNRGCEHMAKKKQWQVAYTRRMGRIHIVPYKGKESFTNISSFALLDYPHTSMMPIMLKTPCTKVCPRHAEEAAEKPLASILHRPPPRIAQPSMCEGLSRFWGTFLVDAMQVQADAKSRSRPCRLQTRIPYASDFIQLRVQFVTRSTQSSLSV